MEKQGNEHEVILLGSSLGGLVAGTLLAKKNHSVLLLKERGYQSSFLKNEYQFTPFSNFSEKRIKLSLLQEIHQALGIPLRGYPEGERQTKKDLGKPKERVSFQVILPGARIDLFPQRSLLQVEWKREFPKEVAQIKNFYNEMDHLQDLLKRLKTKDGSQSVFPFQPSSLAKRLSPFKPFPKEGIDKKLSPFSREFKQFIQLQLISSGNLYSDQIPFDLAAYVLLNDGSNELISNGDLEKLEGSILEQFFQSGGRIEEIDRVEQVDREWRKGFILSLEKDHRLFQSEFLILNLPLHKGVDLLGNKGKWLSKWKKKIQPRYVRLPIFLGIRENVVPVGMKDLLVSILDLERPYEGGNVLFLTLSPTGDETKAPEGRRALTAEGLMPLGKWDRASLIEHQRGVMRHLRRLFPFLEKYIEFIDFKWVNEQVERWSYSHFVYETSSDFNWRAGVVPTRISRRLYFIGKENFPYLGLEGEVLSGWMVAQQILKRYT